MLLGLRAWCVEGHQTRIALAVPKTDSQLPPLTDALPEGPFLDLWCREGPILRNAMHRTAQLAALGRGGGDMHSDRH